MFVNKYVFNNNLTGDTSYNINVPMGTNNGMSGQQIVIDRDFVDIEVDKAVNIIFDYEKVKLLPKVFRKSPLTNIDIQNITYKINFLNPITSANPTPTYNLDTRWADIGDPANKFNDEDLKSKKLAFTKSFLRLDFYDTDIATSQNLITFITLYPKFSYNDVFIGNKIPGAGTYRTTFRLGNPLIDRKENGEGFGLYYFKDEIFPDPLPPKYLYMKATFNNAKDGKSTGLMSTNNPNLSIDKLIETTSQKHASNPAIKNNLHTRYILKRDTEGYFYEIDLDYSTNVTLSGNEYTVNLYQISSK